MSWAVGGLVWIEEVVGSQVIKKVLENNFLKNFGQEWEDRDGAVVFEDVGVEGGLF